LPRPNGAAQQVKRVRTAKVLRLGIPSLLLVLGCLLPFLNKAYVVDDPYFLYQAQQILTEPLNPMGFEICWFSELTCAPAARLAPSGSLMGYLLVPVIVSGGHEWIAHLLQILLLGLAALATVSLGLRLGLADFGAGAAGLIMVACPAVLSSASTAMPDILAMALGVIAIERLLAWKSSGRWRDGLPAAFALGLAPFARAHLFGVVVVAAVFLRDDGRLFDIRSWLRIPLRRWFPLVLGGLVLAAATLITASPDSSISPPARNIAWEHLSNNSRTFLLYWAFPMPLAVAWLALKWRNFPARRLLVSLMLLTFVAVAWLRSPWDALDPTLTVVGLIAILHLLADGLIHNRQRQIALGIWLLVALPALPYLHLPMKYLTASAPAAALLIAAELEGARRRFAIAAAIVALCSGYSLLVLTADREFAGMGRMAATELIETRVRQGERVWFSGIWGFQWYALRAGARQMKPGGPVPQPGDLLVVGHQEYGAVSLRDVPNRELVERRFVAYRGGRTMSRELKAGLYSNQVGRWPWAWGDGVVNVYEVWRVTGR
jgi:hypothetical protein